MSAVGRFLKGVALYCLRQVCAILVALLVLLGASLGAILLAFIVAIIGIVVAFVILIAPLLGLSASSMAAAIKEKAMGAASKADNVHPLNPKT